VSRKDERNAAEIIRSADVECEADDGAEKVVDGRPEAGSRAFASHVANVVRARIGGTPKRTEANRLMVQKMVRDYMKERNVRESHMPRHAPLACALVFVPTKFEVEAKKFEGTLAVRRRDEDAGLWGHVAGLWGLRHFLGVRQAGLQYSSA